MSDFNQAILQAIADLKEDQRTGFAQVNSRLDSLNGRVQKTERDVTRLKTIYSTAAAVVGLMFHSVWDYMTGK